MRVLLITLLLLIGTSEKIVMAQQAGHSHPLDMLTQQDLNFFFESMTFDNHQWIFKLSANTRGMLWRLKTKDADVTGACGSGQILTVPESAISFEIKRKDVHLVFYSYPHQNLSQMSLTFEPEKNLSPAGESRSAIVFWKPTPTGNRVCLAFAED